MNKPPNEISVPAELHKADIGKYASLIGCTNKRPVSIDGKLYESDRIRFLSFFGRFDKEKRRFVGEYRFVVGAFKDQQRADLGKLPNELNDPGEP